MITLRINGPHHSEVRVNNNFAGSLEPVFPRRGGLKPRQVWRNNPLVTRRESQYQPLATAHAIYYPVELFQRGDLTVHGAIRDANQNTLSNHVARIFIAEVKIRNV